MDYQEHHSEGETLAQFLSGRVDRREFIRRAALVTGGSILSFSLLGSLACGPSATPTPGPGETVAPHDPRIEAGPVEFQGEDATLMGYLARPKSEGPHPIVLVLHENTGMLPHFPDVARRLALAG